MDQEATVQKKKQDYFYAEQQAGMYDDTIHLVVPQYSVMHEMIIRLLSYHFRVEEGVSKTAVKATILDIGSGTGAESLGFLDRRDPTAPQDHRGILQEFPNTCVVALDFCEPMHEVFRKNFEARISQSVSDFSSRCHLVCEDLQSDKCTSDLLLRAGQLLDPQVHERGYQAVVSTFTLHHLPTAKKLEAYRRLHAVLEPGGVLINGDLFTFQSDTLAAYAHDYDMESISTSFQQRSDSQQRDDSVNVVLESPTYSTDLQSLRDQWLRHYRDVNLLDPIEAASGWVKEGLVGVENPACDDNLRGQAQMLLEAGFSEVGCPFRFWQVGILWAKK